MGRHGEPVMPSVTRAALYLHRRAARGRALLIPAVFALGFLSAWEASSRGALPRIPQPDDHSLSFAPATSWATVTDPLGRPAILCSFAMCDDGYAKVATADAAAFCATAVFTLEHGVWRVWRKDGAP